MASLGCLLNRYCAMKDRASTRSDHLSLRFLTQHLAAWFSVPEWLSGQTVQAICAEFPLHIGWCEYCGRAGGLDRCSGAISPSAPSL